MNSQKELIVSKAEEFFKLNSFAVVGVSADKKKFGNYIYKELKIKLTNVFQIHPNELFLNDSNCYKSINDIPCEINAVIINVKKDKTKSIVQEYFSYGIKNFWIQKGSESNDLIDYCNINNINVITGKCILMFANPLNSIHKFHHTIWSWFGSK